MEPKAFQFNPQDYATTYETIKSIYHYGYVVKIGNQVAVEYTFEWQLLSLFSQIPNTKMHPPIVERVRVERHSWDKPVAVGILLLLLGVIVWYYLL
jgi:hypothetical protein